MLVFDACFGEWGFWCDVVNEVALVHVLLEDFSVSVFSVKKILGRDLGFDIGSFCATCKALLTKGSLVVADVHALPRVRQIVTIGD